MQLYLPECLSLSVSASGHAVFVSWYAHIPACVRRRVYVHVSVSVCNGCNLAYLITQSTCTNDHTFIHLNGLVQDSGVKLGSSEQDEKRLETAPQHNSGVAQCPPWYAALNASNGKVLAGSHDDPPGWAAG